MIDNAYTGETIRHNDGRVYSVLDTTKIEFESHAVVIGSKTKLTHARAAMPSEVIVTSPGSTEEARYTALGGEVVFINLLPNGVEDAYVPRDAEGNANGQAILEQRYTHVAGDLTSGATYRPNAVPSRLLHEVVDRPTVIKDAWGVGAHQFLDKGATLKADGNRATGIDKAAFDETWSILPPNSGR